MTGVDWGPGIAVLALGLLLGGLVLWRVTVKGARTARVGAPIVQAQRADLEAERDGLFLQLRELEDTSVKRTGEQLARERYAIELRAARVLLALDEGETAAHRGRGKKAGGQRAEGRDAVDDAGGGAAPVVRPALRGFLWGVGSAGALGLLVFLVARGSHPREEKPSPMGARPAGQPATAPASGNGAAEGAADPSSDEEVARYRSALEQNPDDLETRVDLARVYLGRQDLMAVWNETQYVLARSPGHPRALSYQALVRLAMGQADVAEQMLKKAKAQAPDLLEVYLHLSLVYARTGRMPQAEATIAEARKRFPGQAQVLGKLMAEMKEAVAEGPVSLPGDPHASVPAPPAAAAVPAPAAPGPGNSRVTAPAATAGSISGTLDLDSSLKGALSPVTTIFLTLRAADAEGGPPVAVKRLTAGSFPLAFSIGTADSMMGQELPTKVRVEARADSDGDPLTRSPGDPSVRADGVRLGTSDLRLVLRR